MQSKFLSNASEMRFRPRNLILSVALPVLLLLAFLGNQLIRLDAIGWDHGFSHPFEGWDHLVTMLAVGVWAAQMRGKAIWLLPLAFVSVMSLGGLAGAAGLAIPSVEGIILLSCAVFSVLITRKIRFSSKVNVLIVAFFAFFHGFAHGQEISASASLISYTLGFMFATLLLHGAGIIVAKLVVLSVACLLTMLFANASYADMSENNEHGKIKSIALTRDNTFGTLQNVWSFSIQDPGQNAYSAQSVRPGPPGNSASACTVFTANGINSGQMGVVSAPAKNYQARMKQAGSKHGLPLNKAKFQVSHAIQARAPSNVVDAHPVLTAFNRYYPTINYSPGASLLSNGVGLTSPPVLLTSVSFIPAISDSLTSPTFFIEESSLQLRNTPFQLSNFKPILLNGHRHSFARHFEFRSGGNLDTAAFCRANSTQCLVSSVPANNHGNPLAIGENGLLQQAKSKSTQQSVDSDKMTATSINFQHIIKSYQTT